MEVALLRDEEFRIPTSMFTKRSGGSNGMIANWMNRRPNGSCVALDETTRLCTIYDIRPMVCQLFTQGHPQCIDAIDKYSK